MNTKTDQAIESLKAEYNHAKNTLKTLLATIKGVRVLCPKVKNTLEVLRVDIAEMRGTLRFYGVLVD